MKWEFLWGEEWIPSITPTKETMTKLKFHKGANNHWISNSWGGCTWFWRTK